MFTNSIFVVRSRDVLLFVFLPFGLHLCFRMHHFRITRKHVVHFSILMQILIRKKWNIYRLSNILSEWVSYELVLLGHYHFVSFHFEAIPCGTQDFLVLSWGSFLVCLGKDGVLRIEPRKAMCRVSAVWNCTVSVASIWLLSIVFLGRWILKKSLFGFLLFKSVQNNTENKAF